MKIHPRHAGWKGEGASGWRGLALIVVQLILVIAAAHLYRIEEGRGFVQHFDSILNLVDPIQTGLLVWFSVAFVIHAFLPMKWRMPFFLAVSLSGFFKVLGLGDGSLLVLFGLILIGLCHLPVSFRWRAALLAAAGLILGLIRGGVGSAEFSATVLPILGSLFMFRLIIYFYDLKHEKSPVSPWQRLAYFFLGPNVCFPLFPVVDYRTFVRTWHDGRELAIYQKGVLWMARGVIHLMLYRLVYYYLSPAPEEVTDLGGVVAFVFSSYLLYLRISGQFHLIIGLLCLFGFNLPETHHRYLLASGFNDYWRRINIYWKDFMMKLVFNPCIVRFKRFGISGSIAAATAVVFFVTWLLHSYQWFWLRGSFHWSLVDALFWAIFGVLVVINSVFAASRRPKAKLKKSEEKSAFDFTAAARHALQVSAMFVLMCLLWAFWQSHSVGEYVSLLAQAGNASLWQVAALIGVILTVLGLAVLIPWLKHRQFLIWTDDAGARKWQPVVATLVPMTVLILAGTLPGPIDGKLGEVLASMKGGRLNERDQRRLERGYYEGLLERETFASELWEVRLERRPDWVPVAESGVFRFTGDLIEKELLPNLEHEVPGGGTWGTNEWGMPDFGHYSREKPDGVYRIAMIGASYTAGDGIPLEGTFENLLEGGLNELSTSGRGKIEVLNFAVPGYTLIEMVVVNETRIADWQPDAMFMIAHNKEGPRTLGTLARRIREGVPLSYDFLKELPERAGIPRGEPTDDDMRRLNRFREEIVEWGYGRMTGFCKERGILPVWIYLPTTDEIATAEEIEAQRQQAEDAGFVALVLDNAYGEGDPRQYWQREDDRHPDAEGHKQIAKRFIEVVAENAARLGLKVKAPANPQ